MVREEGRHGVADLAVLLRLRAEKVIASGEALQRGALGGRCAAQVWGWRFQRRRASVANSKRCHGRLAMSVMTNWATPRGASGGRLGSGIGPFRCCWRSSSFVPV